MAVKYPTWHFSIKKWPYLLHVSLSSAPTTYPRDSLPPSLLPHPHPYIFLAIGSSISIYCRESRFREEESKAKVMGRKDKGDGGRRGGQRMWLLELLGFWKSDGKWVIILFLL